MPCLILPLTLLFHILILQGYQIPICHSSRIIHKGEVGVGHIMNLHISSEEEFDKFYNGGEEEEAEIPPSASSCSETSVEQKDRKCLYDLLPSINFLTGIPANRYETEAACKAFNQAILCVENYVNRCLNESDAKSFRNTLSPSVTTYKVICRDKVSRARFYRHGECFRKISQDYDYCVDELGRMTDGVGNQQEECCHKTMFLNCIVEFGNFHKCRNDSLQSILETTKLTLQLHPIQQRKGVKDNTKSKMEVCSNSNLKLQDASSTSGWHNCTSGWAKTVKVRMDNLRQMKNQVGSFQGAYFLCVSQLWITLVLV